MRVAVVGATGNIGFALLLSLLERADIEEIVAIARRPPSDPVSGRVRWLSIDISQPDAEPALRSAFEGCAAVVDLAWLIQPGRRPDLLHATNVDGTGRVLAAVAAAGVPALVYASSVGAYAPRFAVPGAGLMADESWPTTGVETSLYSRQKAEVERLLDRFADEFPQCRLVRIRPGFVLSGPAAASQVRYFAGPLLPRRVLRLLLGADGRLPLAPTVGGLAIQVVHSADAAAAFMLAAVTPSAQGAFNIATDPVVNADSLPALLGARHHVRLPSRALRALVALAFRARLTPVDEGWIDLAMAVPVMDTGRARRLLGWRPTYDAAMTLREWLAGAAHGSGGPTPVLRPFEHVGDQARGAFGAISGHSSGRI